MQNIALLWPDYIQPTVSYVPTWSGGSWVSTLPLSNLQARLLSAVARSTDALAASTKFDVDLKVARPIGKLAIGKHNASSDGTIVVKLANVSDFSATVHVSAALALWPAGKTVEEMDGYNVGWFYLPPAGLSARYIRVEITDTANPAGYIELSRFLAGGLFQPAVGLEHGSMSLGWEDPTKVETSRGGTDWFDIRQPFRVKQFQLNHLTSAEGFDQVFEMQRRLGIHGQTYVSLDPVATSMRRWQQSFLCTLRKLSPLGFPYINANSTAYELKEVL